MAIRRLESHERSKLESSQVIKSTAAPPNKLSLQLSGPAWESMKAIAVDRQGTKTYILRPSVNTVTHRLVCQVRLKDNVKVVTFRSTTLIENCTKVTLEIRTVNANGQQTGDIIALGKQCHF